MGWPRLLFAVFSQRLIPCDTREAIIWLILLLVNRPTDASFEHVDGNKTRGDAFMRARPIISVHRLLAPA